MSLSQEFLEYIMDGLGSGEVTYKKMFGGAALYYNNKVVGLIDDDQLFIKQTKAGRDFIGDVVEAPPYPGAKNAFLLGDEIEDKKWLFELIKISEKELPAVKKRNKKKAI